MKKLFLLLFLIFPPLVSKFNAQFYTGSQVDFGKNRIQYNEPRYWTYYNYDRHSVYYYEGGKEIANYVSRSAKQNIEDIEKMLDFPFSKKIQFIIYNKQSDFEQSNIGYSTDEQYNIGGVTKISGTKVILYFEGDHQKLEQQIRAGIAEVILNEMMYGGDVKDMVKNSTLLNFPSWYIQGLISYIAIGWNTDIDNRVRDGIRFNKYKKFNRLTGTDALYAGHSIWYYIAETYGDAVIPNLLYMTKVSRSVESGLLFVLGTSIKTLNSEWFYFYQNRYVDINYDNTKPVTNPTLKKPKSTRVYNQFKISPTGKHAIYATNEFGQYKVWLHDFERNKSKRILKVGQKLERINDYSYPLLAWHPSGLYFSIIRERKGKLLLMQYEIENKEKSERLIINFEKILDFSYADDGKKFVMSAIQNGQSDIFVFTAASNAYEQITKDIYDDLTPRFVNQSKNILFSSNRINDTIKPSNAYKEEFNPQRARDIFMYDYSSRSNVLKRITNTAFISETDPEDYDSLHISYLSDKNGIKNRYLAHLDSVISYIDTSTHYRLVVTSFPASNHSSNIIEQDINVKAKKYTEVIYSKGKYRMYVNDIIDPPALNNLKIDNTRYREEQLKTEGQKNKEQATIIPQKKDSIITINKPELKTNDTELENQENKKIDINNYVFENEETLPIENKNTIPEIKDSSNDTSVTNKKTEFKLSQQFNYNVNYAIDNVTVQLNNNFLGGVYQKYGGGPIPSYTNPGTNAVLGVHMSDLFEDYRITAICKPEFSGGMEYFLSYEDRLKRLDKQYILHRQSYPASSSNVYVHDARYILRYPFTEVTSIRGSLMLRNDRTVYLATNDIDLKKPDSYENWGGAKMEAIFDNTRNRGLNLYNGLRAKLFGEYYQQLDKKETDIYIVGFDGRYYQKIHRDIIWANRIAGSTSFGNQKLVYFMGGVDNWFAPQFDNSVNVSIEQNYAYQTLATNMRGFWQNIRNGNTFMVMNSELRVPLFKYLMNRPIKSDFINNFQVIGFGDIGTAWTGKTPYSEQNFLKKTVISQPGNPIVVTLNNNKEPIVGGYGWGMRSRLWGYFVRLDFAWGVEDREILPRVTYLSFSLDF